MKKPILKEEIYRMRKIMGLKENYDTYFDTSSEDNWQKGGGPEEEEMRTATLKNNPFDKSGKTYVLVDDENGEEYSEFQLVDSMEEVDKMRQQTRIENTYIVKNEVGEDKIAVTFPYTPSRSEFAGKFNEADELDLSKVDNPNAYTDDIINHNAERGEGPSDFDFEKAAIESASGEKVVQRDFDDYDRPLYWSLTNDYVNYYIGDGDNGPMIIKYNAKTGEDTVIGDLKDYDSPMRAKDELDSELFEGSRDEKYDDSHGSPYDRGHSDAYYGRNKRPHKRVGHEEFELTEPSDLEAYNAGYEGCRDFKDWGDMDENNDPEEKMVSFDDLLAQDTDGMSPEDQAMIDAHDEEEANKYASKNYDDVESGAIDEDWGSSDQGYMNKAIHDDLNQPTEFNFGMFDDLKSAAEEAVDHFWSDWEEYNTDRDGLVTKAMKIYLRRYFPDWYENVSKMFS